MSVSNRPGPARDLRPGALVLGLSGLLLAAFPLVRPFFAMPTGPGDTAAIVAAADALTSPAWIVAHLMAAAGLLLLPLGELALYALLARTRGDRGERAAGRAFTAFVLTVIGGGMLLVVIGGEAFGLPAAAQAYAAGESSDIVALLSRVRSPALFGVLLAGLLALAAAGITLAIAVWRSEVLPRWGGVLLGAGLILWMPLLPQVPRVVDGFLIGAGAWWLAWSVWRLEEATPAAAPAAVAPAHP